MNLLKGQSLQRISTVTYMMMLVLLGVNIVVLAGLPWILQEVVAIDLGYGYVSIRNYGKLYRYFLTIMYMSGICSLILLYDLKGIMKSCREENVFVKKNVTRIFRLGSMTFLIAIIFFSKIFVRNSFMTMVLVFAFFMVSVVCFVLSGVFAQAVDYKEENDLTI